MSADDLRLLTVAAAASVTGLSERSIRHLIANRDLPVVRLGRAVRLRAADLSAFIEGHTHRGEPR